MIKTKFRSKSSDCTVKRGCGIIYGIINMVSFINQSFLEAPNLVKKFCVNLNLCPDSTCFGFTKQKSIQAR